MPNHKYFFLVYIFHEEFHKENQDTTSQKYQNKKQNKGVNIKKGF